MARRSTALAVALALLGCEERGPRPLPEALPRGATPAAPPDERLRYAFTSSGRVLVREGPRGGGTPDVGFALEGTLSMEAAAAPGGGERWVLLVEAVRSVPAGARSDAEAARSADAELAQTLAGRIAVLERERPDEAARISFRRDVPRAARRWLAALAARLAFPRGRTGATRWEGSEEGGRVRVTYRREPGGSLLVERATREGSGVQGGGVVHLAAGGVPRQIEHHERSEAGWGTVESTLRLTLTGRDPVPSEGRLPAPPDLEPFAPDPAAEAAEAEREVGRRFADGLTIGTMEAAIVGYGRGIALPKGMLLRMTGLLVAHPELAPRLVSWLASGKVAPRGRVLIADLLSSAGHATAQAALRAALTEPSAREHPEAFAQMLQRFAFFDRPEPASAALVQEERRRSRGTLAGRAALYTLGSVVNRLYAAGRPEAARYERYLREEGRRARTDDDRIAWLAGLGNLGRSENVDLIAPHAASPKASLREQVAQSLRKMTAPAARALLLSLARDAESGVAVRALESLFLHPASPAELDTLAASVRAGALHWRARAALAGHLLPLAKQGAPAPIVIEMLGALERDLLDRPLRADVASALAALPPDGGAPAARGAPSQGAGPAPPAPDR
jgi:hypothetical protein